MRWLIWSLLVALAPAPAAAAGRRIAVAVYPFANRTGDPALQNLEQDIASIVMNALGAAQAFRVVDPALLKRIETEQVDYLSDAYAQSGGPQLGQLTKPELRVSGTIQRAQDRLRLEVRFASYQSGEMLSDLNVDYEVPRSLVQENIGELLSGLTLQISEAVLRYAGGTLDAASRSEIEAVTRSTKSALAAKSFAEGLRHQRILAYSSLIKAKSSFEAALRIDATYLAALAELAAVESHLGWLGYWVGETVESQADHYRRAKELAERARKLAPDSALVLRESARIYERTGQAEKFKEALKRAKQLSPDDPSVLVLESKSEGSVAAKQSLLRRAIEMDPNFVEARFELALVYEDQGMYDLAGNTYAEILTQIDPKHVLATVNLASLEYYNHQPDRTLKLCDQAQSVEPLYSVISHSRAYSLSVLGKDVEAQRSMREAIKKNAQVTLRFQSPTSSQEAWHQRTLARAREVYNRHPNSIYARLALGWKLAESNDTNDQNRGLAILRELDGAPGIAADNVEVPYGYAMALRKLGYHDDAIAAFERAASRAPDLATKELIEVDIAITHYYKRNYSKARAAFGRIMQATRNPSRRVLCAVFTSWTHREQDNYELGQQFIEQNQAAANSSYDQDIGWLWREMATTYVQWRGHLAKEKDREKDANKKAEIDKKMQEHTTKALEAFDRSLEAYGADPYAHAERARFLAGLGRADEALKEVERAAELDAKYLDDLADLFIQLGRPRDAEKAFNQAITKDPSNPDLAFRRASFFERQERWAEAKTSFEDAYELRPSRPYLEGVVRTMERLGQKAQAVAVYEKAVREDPGNASWYLNSIGLVLDRGGDLEGALGYYRRSAQAGNGKDVVVQWNAAVTLSKLKRYPEAETEFQRALQIDPRYERTYEELAWVHRQQKQPQKALQLLERGLGLLPGSRSVRDALANTLYYDLKDYDRTLRYVTDWEGSDPGHTKNPNLAGLCLVQLKRYGEAVDAFYRALQLSREDHVLYANLGFALEQAGRYDEAFGAYMVSGWIEEQRDIKDRKALGYGNNIKSKVKDLKLPSVVPDGFLVALVREIGKAQANGGKSSSGGTPPSSAQSTPPPSSSGSTPPPPPSELEIPAPPPVDYGEPTNRLARGFFWTGLAIAAAGGGSALLSHFYFAGKLNDGTVRTAVENEDLVGQSELTGLLGDVGLSAGGGMMALGFIFWLAGVGESDPSEVSAAVSPLPGGGMATVGVPIDW